MPNQLAKSKRRQSLAEHEAVLAALAEIARREQTTVMSLLRCATRAFVSRRPRSASEAKTLRQIVLNHAPRPPKRFKSAAEVARFKRAQREFDQVLRDLNLATPADIQRRNSLTQTRPRLLDFDRAHESL